jgi:hypothetical protein
MYLDSSQIVNQDYYETVKDISTCIICAGIIIDPLQCLSCENCFCKNCINAWIKKSNTCPFKCAKIETKEASRLVKNMMSRLIFKCPLYSCERDIPYEDLSQHEKKCTTETTTCPMCKSTVKKSCLGDRKSNDELKIELEIMSKLIEELKTENEQLKKTQGSQNVTDISDSRGYRAEDDRGYKGYKDNYKKHEHRDRDYKDKKDFGDDNESRGGHRGGRGGYKGGDDKGGKHRGDRGDNEYKRDNKWDFKDRRDNDSRYEFKDARELRDNLKPNDVSNIPNNNNPQVPNFNELSSVNNSIVSNQSSVLGVSNVLGVNQNNSNIKNSEVPVNFPYAVYRQDCEHFASNVVSIFECCNKAYPCRKCHKLADKGHKMGKAQFIYCKNCLTVNPQTKNKCGTCKCAFYSKRIQSNDSGEEEPRKKIV